MSGIPSILFDFPILLVFPVQVGTLYNRVFHSLYKVGRNGSISIKGFQKKLLPVVLNLMQKITISLGALTNWAKLVYAIILGDLQISVHASEMI